MMEAGRYGTIAELAAAEKINSSYVSRVLRLTLLAPEIVKAILDGRAAGGNHAARARRRLRRPFLALAVTCPRRSGPPVV